MMFIALLNKRFTAQSYSQPACEMPQHWQSWGQGWWREIHKENIYLLPPVLPDPHGLIQTYVSYFAGINLFRPRGHIGPGMATSDLVTVAASKICSVWSPPSSTHDLPLPPICFPIHSPWSFRVWSLWIKYEEQDIVGAPSMFCTPCPVEKDCAGRSKVQR